MILKSPEVSVYVPTELYDFSESLVTHIERVSNPVVDNSELREREESKQYIEKLIEYIGKTVLGNGKMRAVKYLLMSFIEVLSIAGQQQPTEKAKRKVKEQIIVLFYIIIAHFR